MTELDHVQIKHLQEELERVQAERDREHSLRVAAEHGREDMKRERDQALEKWIKATRLRDPVLLRPIEPVTTPPGCCL